MKSIVFISDAWTSAGVNGVVTWLTNTRKILEQRNFKTTIIHPGLFYNIPLPNYPEVKLSLFAKNKMQQMIKAAKPDYICIVTEGPLGFTARRICKANNWKFSTFYHTRFPEYIDLRLGGFKETAYSYMRWFHKPSSCVMVGSKSMKDDLIKERFENVVYVPEGVDLGLFQRNEKASPPAGLAKPIFTFMGRLAPEKNLEAFLDCELPGSKLIIGDGPSKAELEQKYSDAKFVGYKKGQELVDLLSISDVFVFPSKTDTFGLTMIEAMACGIPVAAFDVTGPKDVVTNGETGYLGENLAENAKKCLQLDKNKCMQKAHEFTWENSVKIFAKNLVPIKP